MAWSQDGWGFGSQATSHFGLPVAVLSKNTDTGPIFTDVFSNRFKLGPFVNTAVFMQNAIRESLSDGSGRYFYILPGGVTNDELATVSTYTVVARPTSTWGLITTSTASWVTG